MCGFFNIQVSNPYAIMHQNTSREFVAGSSEERKCGLFMTGTLITAVHEELNELSRLVERTREQHRQKAAELKVVLKDFREAKREHEVSEEAAEIEKEIHDTQEELAWTWVIAGEAEVERMANESENAEELEERASARLDSERDYPEYW
jgi:chromosome segregation ATPase